MIAKQLKEKFTLSFYNSYPNEVDQISEDLIEITKSTQKKFGHYQCNAAMKLSRLLKSNPRKIAEELCKNFESSMVEKLEIAGPGFINITLSRGYLSQKVREILDSSSLGVEQSSNPQKVLIDYSSPNIAKEMHVGHLRSTIIGESLARLFECVGDRVVRLNHIGDWGTSFGMLIAFLKEEHLQVLEGDSNCSLSELVFWYREAKAQFDVDAAFKKRSQEEVVALQSGDLTSKKCWEIICEISRQAYEEVYQLLETSLIERGESFYNSMLAPLINDLEGKGFVEESDGAKCIFLEGYVNREGEPLPLMIQKSDGGYNYASTDLAALRYRFKEESADRVIYVTDAGQAMHFKMCFEASALAGYWDNTKNRVDHVPFGLVLRSDGKKFRTRSGDTERLIDLLYQAIQRASDVLKERDFEGDELEETARALGLGAVKYADLSSHRTSDYVFSYDKMLSFEGNTAAFLLYAYVRIVSIQKKVVVKEDISIEGGVELEHPSEIALGLVICQFSEAVHLALKDLLPNRICEYLFSLAEAFNAFFRDCKVVGSEEQHSRLLLCQATATILKKGLYILGIQTVDKM